MKFRVDSIFIFEMWKIIIVDFKPQVANMLALMLSNVLS